MTFQLHFNSLEIILIPILYYHRHGVIPDLLLAIKRLYCNGSWYLPDVVAFDYCVPSPPLLFSSEAAAVAATTDDSHRQWWISCSNYTCPEPRPLLLHIIEWYYNIGYICIQRTGSLANVFRIANGQTGLPSLTTIRPTTTFNEMSAILHRSKSRIYRQG